MIATLLAVLILKFTLATAQTVYTGPCPKDAKPMKDFDVKQYLGRWYEYARYSPEFDLHVKCAYDEFKMVGSGTMLMKHTKLFEPNFYYYKLAKLDVFGPGRLWMHPTKLNANIYPIPYWILGTDYKNYAIVYSCREEKPIYINFLLILMRNRTLTAEQIEETQQIITNNSLEVVPLVKTDHTDCDKKISGFLPE